MRKRRPAVCTAVIDYWNIERIGAKLLLVVGVSFLTEHRELTNTVGSKLMTDLLDICKTDNMDSIVRCSIQVRLKDTQVVEIGSLTDLDWRTV